MTKIVYNACYGGFSLSDEGFALYTEYGGVAESMYDIDRTEPALVNAVEELGARANGRYANLKIRELPTGTRYRIDEYDGSERVITIDEYEWRTA